MKNITLKIDDDTHLHSGPRTASRPSRQKQIPSSRVGQMTGCCGWAPEHFRVGDSPHLGIRVDRIGTDEKLLRLAMDQAVRRSPADTFGMNRLYKVRTD